MTERTPDTAPPADDTRGTIGMSAQGDWQIRFERHLPHSVARVWQAITEPDQQDRWVPGVRIVAEPGGAVVFDFGGEGGAEGEVLAVDPPTSIEHTWRWPGEPDSVVRWEIQPDGDGAVLVLLHRPVRPEPAVHYSAGWHTMLDSLAVHLDGGDPGALTPDYEQQLVDWYTAQASG